MSFYIGNNSCDNIPGPINGNPTNGLCKRICIQTKKVFDACLSQQQLEDELITLTNFTPANPTAPLSFISGQNSTTVPFTLQNVTVERIVERPNFARVTATINVPVDIIYIDANNVEGTATGTFQVTQDVILYVPQPSLVPYRVEAYGGAILTEGTFPTGATSPLTANVCLALVIKIVAETELLIPSYGYCCIPPCQAWTNDVCNGFFDLPIFPTPARGPNNQNT